MKITSLAFPINNYKNPEFKLTSTIDGRRSILSWNYFEERSFPSSSNSHFQNEAQFKTVRVKMCIWSLPSVWVFSAQLLIP